MKLLLDSHVLLWALYAPSRLTERVQDLLHDSSNELVVSHASLWELLNKIGRGKLLLAGSSIHTTAEDVFSLGVTLLPIKVEHILLAASLFHHHSDPFDRMLVAHAMAEDLPILSADGMLNQYDVSVIWS